MKLVLRARLRNRMLAVTLATVFLGANLSRSEASAPSDAWLSPSALVASPDGKVLYVACATAQRLLALDSGTGKVTQQLALPGSPTGLAMDPAGQNLLVTCAGTRSEVCVVDMSRLRVLRKLNAGHTAMAPVLSRDGRSLFVCNRFNDDVSVLDLRSGKERRRIRVRREPVAAALSLDGRHLLVANHLHDGRADGDHVGAVISVIDTSAGRVVKEIALPDGSGVLNDIRVSPDGRYAVVSHILSRFRLPTTQLDRGWMNTNAKSILAMDTLSWLNTVLVDSVDRGAANPWGLTWADQGAKLVLAHAGTHEISVIDFTGLLERLAKLTALASASTTAAPYLVGASRSPSDVPNDLSFLVGFRERLALPEGDWGPRAVVAAGGKVYTANYYSDTLSVWDLQRPARVESIALGPKPVMTPERLGEVYFHDARICYQGWQSCATCHPGEARVDALNWDLLNDDLGTPKNNKSLLLCFETPPAMSIAVRESAEAAVRAGIRHILFTVQPPEVAASMDAYLKALRPVPSPHLVRGRLSAAAERGARLFHSREVGCAECHPAPLFTDLQSYDVGTRGRYDRPSDVFDTPTLIELWRTAPYLHDGSVKTLRDVLKEGNRDDQHGRTSHLTPRQLDDLTAYLLSL